MEPDAKKVLQLLGLATRAGKIVSGEFSVKCAVQQRKACVVFVAADASDRTKKLFHDKCAYYGVPIRVFAEKEKLGHAVGQEARASLACTDKGFAKALLAACAAADGGQKDRDRNLEGNECRR